MASGQGSFYSSRFHPKVGWFVPTLNVRIVVVSPVLSKVFRGRLGMVMPFYSPERKAALLKMMLSP
jgi:hypothetical protein